MHERWNNLNPRVHGCDGYSSGISNTLKIAHGYLQSRQTHSKVITKVKKQLITISTNNIHHLEGIRSTQKIRFSFGWLCTISSAQLLYSEFFTWLYKRQSVSTEIKLDKIGLNSTIIESLSGRFQLNKNSTCTAPVWGGFKAIFYKRQNKEETLIRRQLLEVHSMNLQQKLQGFFEDAVWPLW